MKNKTREMKIVRMWKRTRGLNYLTVEITPRNNKELESCDLVQSNPALPPLEFDLHLSLSRD